MSEFRRQHPVAAIAQLLAVLRQNIPTLLILFFVGTKNSGDYFWWSMLGGVILAFVLGIASWFRFTFRVYEGELQINKGIFVRKKLYLSKDRIQVIDITEGLLQRVFGLVKVEIKSAGGGTEKATISAITKDEAETMQALLRDEAPAQQTEGDHEVIDQPISETIEYPSWKLSGRDLFLAAFTSGNFGVIASILGAVAGQLDQFITDENMEYVYDHLPGMGQLSVVLWMIFFVIFISYLLSFIGVILSFADFKIQKKEKELVITSGLLERKQITVPFNRIQAVRFVEGITRQPLGCGMLYVESAGFEKKDQNRSIVLVPFIRKVNVREFLQEFVPDLYQPEESITPPQRAMFRYLRRPNYLLIPAVSALWFFWTPGWMLYALAIPFTLYGWLEYKAARVAFDDLLVTLSYRKLAKTTAFIKRNRIQVADISVNPFQQRKKLCNFSITAASGAGGKAFSVENMDQMEMQKLYEWVVPQSEFPSQAIDRNVDS